MTAQVAGGADEDGAGTDGGGAEGGRAAGAGEDQGSAGQREPGDDAHRDRQAPVSAGVWSAAGSVHRRRAEGRSRPAGTGRGGIGPRSPCARGAFAREPTAQAADHSSATLFARLNECAAAHQALTSRTVREYGISLPAYDMLAVPREVGAPQRRAMGEVAAAGTARAGGLTQHADRSAGQACCPTGPEASLSPGLQPGQPARTRCRGLAECPRCCHVEPHPRRHGSSPRDQGITGRAAIILTCERPRTGTPPCTWRRLPSWR